MFPNNLAAAEVPQNRENDDREAQLLFWAEMVRAQWEDLYKPCQKRADGLISAKKWFESDDFTYSTSFRVACEHLSWDYRWVRQIVFSGPPPKAPLNNVSLLMRKRRKDCHDREDFDPRNRNKNARRALENPSRRRRLSGRGALGLVAP